MSIRLTNVINKPSRTHKRPFKRHKVRGTQYTRYKKLIIHSLAD